MQNETRAFDDALRCWRFALDMMGHLNRTNSYNQAAYRHGNDVYAFASTIDDSEGCRILHFRLKETYADIQRIQRIVASEAL